MGNDANAGGDVLTQDEGQAFDKGVYRAFVASLRLEQVETIKVAAHRLRVSDVISTETEIEPSFAVDHQQGAVFFKYDLAARVLDAEDAVAATIDVTVVLVFATPMTDAEPAMIDHFAGSSAYLMAHPYLREALGATALRIGFPGVLLPVARN